MNDNDIQKRVVEALKKSGINIDKQAENYIFFVDSLEFVRIICALEDEFSILINEDDIMPQYYQSIQSICKIIKKYTIK